MQPPNGQILTGTNLTSTRSGTEPQGVAAPVDLETAGDRQPFRRVLSQEQATDAEAAIAVTEPTQGGGDLPESGNGMPVGNAALPDSSTGGEALKPTSLETDLTGLPDEGVLPVLTDVALGTSIASLIAAEDPAITTSMGYEPKAGAGTQSASSQPTAPQRGTVTVPILTNPVSTTFAGGDESDALTAFSRGSAVSVVEPRSLTNAAEPGQLPTASQSVKTEKPVGPAAQSPLVTLSDPALRQPAIGTTGRSEPRIERLSSPVADAGLTRPQLSSSVSPSTELLSDPNAAASARPRHSRDTANIASAAVGLRPTTNGQRVGLDVMPVASAPEGIEIGLPGSDFSATRGSTLPGPTAVTAVPATAASQPTVQGVTPSTIAVPAQYAIDVPVLDPAWQTAVNERFVWMAGRGGVQSAELRLSPAELGPLQVQLAVDERGVSLTINAAHPATREALENALPRLRDMLSEQGMNLADANVSDQGVNDGQARDSDSPVLASGDAAKPHPDALSGETASTGPIRPTRDGLGIDLFA